MALATSSVSLIGAWPASLGTASSHLVPHQGAESRGPVTLDCGIARATFGDAHGGLEVEQRKPNRARQPGLPHSSPMEQRASQVARELEQPYRKGARLSSGSQ
jgi:hypothetical protein